MNIITSSINDITEEFEHFSNTLDGLDYVVPMESRIFGFIDDNKEIAKQDLDFIFHEKKLIGTLEKTSWEDLGKVIFQHLSYCNDHRLRKPGDFLPMVDIHKTIERSKLFWSIINEHVPLPPTKAYYYHPEEGCYLDEYVMWVLCIVLINEETQTGIFVYMGASD